MSCRLILRTALIRLITIGRLANIVNGRRPLHKKVRTTLIVASPAILNQWYQEISKHCYTAKENRHGLGTFFIYKASGMKASDPLDMISNNEIVLTTYWEVAASYPDDKPPVELVDPKQITEWKKENFERNKGTLHKMKFLRVVLDEAHAIKNHRSVTSKACRALEAKHFWAITGTPIMNTVSAAKIKSP